MHVVLFFSPVLLSSAWPILVELPFAVLLNLSCGQGEGGIASCGRGATLWQNVERCTRQFCGLNWLSSSGLIDFPNMLRIRRNFFLEQADYLGHEFSFRQFILV
jgi:hypothetical protein